MFCLKPQCLKRKRFKFLWNLINLFHCLIDYHRVNNPKYTFHPSREVLHLSTCPHIGRVKVLNESGKWKGAWHIFRRLIFNKEETSSAVCATRQLLYFKSLPRKHFPLILQLVQGCLHCLVWSFIRLLIKIFPCTHMHCLIDRDVQGVFLTGPPLNLLSVGQ